MSKWISIKIIIERVKGWLGAFNFAMIMYLFIAESPYDFVTISVLMGIAVISIGLFDYKFIFPKEIGKVASKNPFLINLQNDITEIKEKVCHQ